MILGIDGPYGIGKTAFAVWYAKEFKKKYGNDGIVVSNIKLYGNPFEDYIHFDYANLTNVLRLINYINDSERKDIKNRYKLSNGKLEYKRGAFTKFLILFDESGSLLNKHQQKEYKGVMIQYINQTRKINYDLVMTSVLGDENFKQLRDKVDTWYTLKQPFEKIKYLDGIRTIYREKRETDGMTLKTEKFIGKDIKGDRVLKERPLRWYFDWFYKPLTYEKYDDLYKNIDDKDIPIIYDVIKDLTISKKLIQKYNIK